MAKFGQSFEQYFDAYSVAVAYANNNIHEAFKRYSKGIYKSEGVR